MRCPVAGHTSRVTSPETALRVLVAGSSGFLGTLLRERLHALGHSTTSLVRREAGEHEVRWDPYAGPLDPAVVDDHDVVVNLAGSPLVGNVHSQKWAREVMTSRVTTTSVLAAAIAAGERRPAFLAGNGIAGYGDHGAAPLPESTPLTGDALLARVSRAWQEAADPAAAAGARVVVLRTAPVMDRRSQPLGALRLLFKTGLGGPLGSGRQHMPMVSARDWVDAVVHLATHDGVSGPANLCCEHTPTNAEFTKALAKAVHRPAVVKVPAAVLDKAAGAMAPELLGSVNGVPRTLLDSGFVFSDPTVAEVVREGLSPSR